MDNLPTAPEVSSQTVAPVVPTPVTSPVLPATSVAPSSPPSSSKKMIMIVVGVLVVLGLAYAAYAYMTGSTATQEPAKITSEAPPSLKMATTGLKGSFTETDPTYGFIAFNATDVKNFKVPTNTGYADLEAGVNYVYTLRSMTWKEVASQYIDPAADKAFMAFFDPSIGKFKVYPRGPFADTVTMTEPAFSTETIPAGRGGIIISRGKSKAYNFANGKTKALATAVTAVDPKVEGWVLLPATSTKVKDLVSTLNGMDQVMYVQKSQTEFEKVINKDTQELKDYFLLWVYLQKPNGTNGINDGTGGGTKPPVFSVTGFTPSTITLNALIDMVTVQSLPATLVGDNLDTISTITSNDPSVTTNTIVATAKNVTYKIEVKPGATLVDKVFVAKSKDGATLGSWKIPAVLPSAATDTAPKNIVFLPKALTLPGVPGLQLIDGTLTGENLDTVETITTSDPLITVIVQKVDSKLVNFLISFTEKATKGNKTFTINGKDKKAITTFIIPAALKGENAVVQPVITTVTPSFVTQGDTGKEITITGENLLDASVTSVDDMEIVSQTAATATSLAFKVNVTAQALVGTDKVITVTRIGNATPAVYKTFVIKASTSTAVSVSAPAAILEPLTGAKLDITKDTALSWSAAIATNLPKDAYIGYKYGIAPVTSTDGINFSSQIDDKTLFAYITTTLKTSAVLTSKDAKENLTKSQPPYLKDGKQYTAKPGSYMFGVQAAVKKNVGDEIIASSDWKTITFTVPAVPETMAAPTAAAGDKTVTLTWVAPKSDFPIKEYTITPSVGSPIVVASTQTTYTFSGLTNDTLYTFTITATNTDGKSAASPASTPVTPKAVIAADPLIGLDVMVRYYDATNSATNQWFKAKINKKDASGKYEVTFASAIKVESPGVYIGDLEKAGETKLVETKDMAVKAKLAEIIPGAKMVARSAASAKHWSVTVTTAPAASDMTYPITFTAGEVGTASTADTYKLIVPALNVELVFSKTTIDALSKGDIEITSISKKKFATGTLIVTGGDPEYKLSVGIDSYYNANDTIQDKLLLNYSDKGAKLGTYKIGLEFSFADGTKYNTPFDLTIVPNNIIISALSDPKTVMNPGVDFSIEITGKNLDKVDTDANVMVDSDPSPYAVQVVKSADPTKVTVTGSIASYDKGKVAHIILKSNGVALNPPPVLDVEIKPAQ